MPCGTYKVSNVFPFDDSETTWQGTNFDITFPVPVSIVGYYLINGSIYDWKISNSTSIIDTRIETFIETSNYYSLSATSNYFSFSSSYPATLGGIVFYDTNGRITPKLSNLTQLVDPYSPIKGGTNQDPNPNKEYIIFTFPPETDIYSYTIYANPFPSNWQISTNFGYNSILHTVNDYYTNVSSESFVLTKTLRHPDYKFTINATQPSDVSTARINYIQFYDIDGKMLFPVMTSNTTYTNSDRSGEVYGQYELLATSSKSAHPVELAFDGLSTTYYESLGDYSPTILTNLTLKFSNITVYNCFDFRNTLQASRGRILDTNTEYIWRWGGTISFAANSKLIIDYTKKTITKPAGTIMASNESFLTSPLLTAHYQTAGVNGEWLQIKMPTSINIGSFRIIGDNIQQITMMASNDSINWAILKQYTYTPESQIVTTYTYKYFRAVVVPIVPNTPFKVYHFELYNKYGRLNSYLI